MVKAPSFFKRRSGLGVEEFQTYWRSRHPEVVTNLPGVRRLRARAGAGVGRDLQHVVRRLGGAAGHHGHARVGTHEG